MPRQPRAEYEAGIHHVYARGNRRQEIYADDADRRKYLATLGRVTTRMNWRCLAYCLMGNHFHLLVETVTPNLGTGMQRLQGPYAQYFNRRHGYSGHLYQDRFDAVGVENDAQQCATAAYIARNPVNAGLCSDPADWPWSSHAVSLGYHRPAWLDDERLYAYFGAAGGDGRRRYVEYVDAAKLLKGDSPL